MPLPPSTQRAIADLVAALAHDDVIDAVRRTRLTTTKDGFTRGERIDGLVRLPALPAIPATAIDPPEGVDADDLEAYLADLQTLLDTLGTTYLPINNPPFTGTLTGPDIALTGTLSAVAGSFTGNVNAGNSASDELRVYNLIGQGTAPSLAAGAAMGTSPGAQTITGHDVSGTIIQNAGTSTTTGVLWTLTFANAKASATYRVYLQSLGTNGADVRLYVTNRTTGGFDIGCRVAPTASTQMAVAWLVFGP